MIKLFEDKSYNAKYNAQANLIGRTHYVDDNTLRFHKSRVIKAQAHDRGLLFSIVTSDAVDMHNTSREFRYVIFDVFGTVLGRLELGDGYRTSRAAEKAMYDVLNGLDAMAITLEGIENEKKNHAREIEWFLETFATLKS